jgi:uncharacterized protein (TIRG00374 family)
MTAVADPIAATPGRGTKWRFLLRIALSFGLLALVLVVVGVDNLANAWVSIDPRYLLLVAAIYHVDRGLMAYKWGLLLRAIGIRIPYFILFRIYAIVPLTTLVASATIGGELFRIYNISRLGVKPRDTFASIVAERAIGFATILLLAFIGLFLVFMTARNSQTAEGSQLPFAAIGLALVIGSIVTGLLLVLLVGGFKNTIGGLATRFAHLPLVKRLHSFYGAYSSYGAHRRVLGIVTLWSLLEQMMPVIVAFVLAQALDISVSFLELMALIPLIQFVVRLPFSYDGIGVAEVLAIALFGVVGVPAAEAVLLTVVHRVVQLLSVLPWGIHYLMVGPSKAPSERPALVA